MNKSLYNYDPITVSKSTFKGGLNKPVHSWFRLTPSFAPELVQHMLSKTKSSDQDIILDPFNGAGTTTIESQLNGYKGYGFEINPFLHWVGKTSCNWDIDEEKLIEYKEILFKEITKLQKKINFNNLESYGLVIPSIHNPLRWWNKDVITNLLIIKKSIHEVIHEMEIKNFFLLAIASVLVPDLSNVTLGRLQLHFIDRSNEKIDAVSIFKKQLETMILDFQKLPKSSNNFEIINTDSTNLNNIKIKDKVDSVITSPPYPNRYSYVWNTRPHLYFLDFLSTPKDAADLDKSTIGGTWGTATSILQKDIISPKYDFLSDIELVVNDIRNDDNLMANYVMKYFNLLADQIAKLELISSNNIKCAYVVGNSRIKKRYIETDSLLAKIFEGLGYKVSEIHRFRKRNSGTDLYESIVYAKKHF